MPDEQHLEEQLVSQAVEKIVTQQLDAVEQINIDVQTDLLKIAQGQVDTVSVSGQGLVMQQDIRIQEIKLQTDSIAINPLSAIFGQIKLNEPVNAIVRITLTEVDINRTLTSDYVTSQMQNFELDVNGEIVSFDLQKIQVFLPEIDQMEFSGKVQLKERGNTRPLSFTARISPRTHSQPLMLESFNCIEGKGISLEVIVALMLRVKELINIPYFEWEDMAFHIKEMKVEKGSLILLVEAYIRQIPSL